MLTFLRRISNVSKSGVPVPAMLSALIRLNMMVRQNILLAAEKPIFILCGLARKTCNDTNNEWISTGGLMRVTGKHLI